MSVEESALLWLGLDIGGANIKAAHSSGMVQLFPFELWKRPSDLPVMLSRITKLFPKADRVAVTMTAELCDCFATKSEGVAAVLGSVWKACPGKPIHVWGVDGQFHSVEESVGRPELPAAANWLALATLAARLIPEGPGILIDIGSTTADLIPLRNGQPEAQGLTDTQRLQSGELVYVGVRRTPIMALATVLPHRGVPTGLAAELFASTLDIYVTLGDIPSDPTDDGTADGRPATPEASRDRLARMVAADRNDFTTDDAIQLAKAADEALLARLLLSAERACVNSVGRPSSRSFADQVILWRDDWRPCSSHQASRSSLFDEAWGPLASQAGCALPWSSSRESGRALRLSDRSLLFRHLARLISFSPNCMCMLELMARRCSIDRSVVKIGGSLLNWKVYRARLVAF